MKVSKKIIKIN